MSLYTNGNAFLRCSVHGCGGGTGEEGAAHGFCAHHARNWHRCGHPEGIRVKTAQALAGAAFGFAEAITEGAESRHNLAMAAVDFALARIGSSCGSPRRSRRTARCPWRRG